jgi:membrane protease YdiL (CAAX protease family)
LRGIASNFGVGFAILASSAIFAVFHISISKMIPAFILGIALALIYIRYGSIWPSIMVHSVHNATAVLMAKSAESNLI